MSKPKIAVIGSCVSRDVFNSNFVPNYKDDVELVSSVYQSALPSFARENPIYLSDQDGIKPSYRRTLSEEFDGKNLERIVSSKPDFILMDFYADVHFGVTALNRNFITRNHMAFIALKDADRFYDDTGDSPTLRLRYEEPSKRPNEYSSLAVSAMTQFLSRLEADGNNSQVIINSARFANEYKSTEESIKKFEALNRLNTKNRHWNQIDTMLIDQTNALQIKYPDELFLADETHKWGLNPVHYTKAYYDYLWENLTAFTS